MISVVIVEDESKILRMLKNLIDWNSYGFDVIATAQDGLSGEKIILQCLPDVVITDVRMPGCDGIEMIKKMKDKLPETEFIILSGYRHFEYAHSAMSLGVRNYLLKPIDEGQLISILTRIKQSRESLSEQLLKQRKAFEEMKLQRSMLRNSLIHNLSTSEVFLPGDSLSAINKQYCTAFQDGRFRVITLQFDNTVPLETAEGKIFLPEVIELINHIYAEYTCDCVAAASVYDITFMINYTSDSETQIAQCHNVLFDRVHILTGEYGSYAVTIGISAVIEDIRNLKQGYHASVHALQQSLIDGRDNIIFYDRLSLSHQKNARQLFNENAKLQLLNFISSNNMDALKKWTESFIPFLQDKDFSAPSFYGLCQSITDEALNYFINVQNIELDKNELIYHLNTKMVAADSIESLVNILYDFLLLLLKNFTVEKMSNSLKMVQKAQTYIDENFKHQIRLEDVANAVNLNTTYLCGLFKSEAGITFSEYLTNKRMDEAKKLLRDSSLNIITIAMECGYSDVKYFSKLFIKTVGIRPTEYRDLYS